MHFGLITCVLLARLSSISYMLGLFWFNLIRQMASIVDADVRQSVSTAGAVCWRAHPWLCHTFRSNFICRRLPAVECILTITLALNFDLRPSSLNLCHNEPACHISRSKVISFESYHPDTQTNKHTHTHSRLMALHGH